jgi:hypothetical protein
LTLHVTLEFEFPVTVAVNCADPPARTFAVDGLTVTIVDPGVVGLLGLEGDVGLDPPVVLVVTVFAIPPQAHATSAKSSGSTCNTGNRVERLVERIALTHLAWICRCNIFSFRSASALLDRGVAMGQCPQRKVFHRKNL